MYFARTSISLWKRLNNKKFTEPYCNKFCKSLTFFDLGVWNFPILFGYLFGLSTKFGLRTCLNFTVLKLCNRIFIFRTSFLMRRLHRNVSWLRDLRSSRFLWRWIGKWWRIIWSSSIEWVWSSTSHTSPKDLLWPPWSPAKTHAIDVWSKNEMFRSRSLT